MRPTECRLGPTRYGRIITILQSELLRIPLPPRRVNRVRLVHRADHIEHHHPHHDEDHCHDLDHAQCLAEDAHPHHRDERRAQPRPHRVGHAHVYALEHQRQPRNAQSVEERHERRVQGPAKALRELHAHRTQHFEHDGGHQQQPAHPPSSPRASALISLSTCPRNSPAGGASPNRSANHSPSAARRNSVASARSNPSSSARACHASKRLLRGSRSAGSVAMAASRATSSRGCVCCISPGSNDAPAYARAQLPKALASSTLSRWPMSRSKPSTQRKTIAERSASLSGKWQRIPPLLTSALQATASRASLAPPSAVSSLSAATT